MPLIQVWAVRPATAQNGFKDLLPGDKEQFYIQPLVHSLVKKESPLEFNMVNTVEAPVAYYQGLNWAKTRAGIESSEAAKVREGSYVYVLDVNEKVFKSLKNKMQPPEDLEINSAIRWHEKENVKTKVESGVQSTCFSIQLDKKDYTLVGAMRSSVHYGLKKTLDAALFVNPRAKQKDIQAFAKMSQAAFARVSATTIEVGYHELFEKNQEMLNKGLPLYEISPHGYIISRPPEEKKKQKATEADNFKKPVVSPFAHVKPENLEQELPKLCSERATAQRENLQGNLPSADYDSYHQELRSPTLGTLKLFDENTDFAQLDYHKDIAFVDTDAAGVTAREAVYIKSNSWSDNAANGLYQFNTEMRKNYFSIEAKLEALQSKVNKLFKSDDITDIVRSQRKNHPDDVLKTKSGEIIPLVPLHEFINHRAGKCRHHSFFNAFLLGALVSNKVLPSGSVKHFKGTAYNGSAHTWVIYQINGNRYLIDSTNARGTVFNISDPVQRTTAIQYYKDRGLDGVLDEMLVHYKLITQTNRPIPQALLQFAPDEESLGKEERAKLEKFICPISGEVMKEPVQFKSPRTSHIFYYDKESITNWLQAHNTDPNTREEVTVRQYSIGQDAQKLKQEITDYLKTKQPKKTEDQMEKEIDVERDKLFRARYQQMLQELSRINSGYANSIHRFFRMAHKSRYASVDRVQALIKGLNENSFLSYEERYLALKDYVTRERNFTQSDHDGIMDKKTNSRHDGRKWLASNKSRLVVLYDGVLAAGEKEPVQHKRSQIGH